MSANLDRWNRMKFTRSTQINKQADIIIANRFRYERVEEKTGVPWDVIGVIHHRESNGSFAGVLHNGQRIIGTGKKTTLVPKGRGPFSSWEEAAIDALTNVHPYAARVKDWSIENTLDLLERYNGLGYRRKGRPSPYLWAGTDQYVKGKYVADGKYDANHVDKQLGTAPVLYRIREIVAADNMAPVPVPTPRPTKPDTPKDDEPITHSKRFWTWLTTGGGTAVMPFVDWRVQVIIALAVVGFAVYAIATMPSVRKMLGIEK